MFEKKINISFILFLFCCLQAAAQDSTLVGKSVKWNLEQCIDYARKNNIQINTLRLTQQTSQQAYLLAKAARLWPLHNCQIGDKNKRQAVRSGSLVFYLIC